MSRFGSDPLEFFIAVYKQGAPWDIGAAQPAMVDMLQRYPPSDPILDVGCGSGDLSIHLATLGHQVLGIDFVEAAIAGARERAAVLPADVSHRLELRVADALHPSALGRQFGAVVDSAFLHLFDPDQCKPYIDELARTVRPGGYLYLHEFAIEFPVPNMPRQISVEEVRSRFTTEKGWNIKEVRSTEFFSRVAPPVAATAACIERLPASTADEA